MLPAVIRAELNYIRARLLCSNTICLSVSLSHTFSFSSSFLHRGAAVSSSFHQVPPPLKGRCPKSIAFTQFISGEVNTAEWNGGDVPPPASLNSCDANAADRHQVQWKGTENKHYCWIVDNSMLHSPEQRWGNSKQTIMFTITSTRSSDSPVSEPRCRDSIISTH